MSVLLFDVYTDVAAVQRQIKAAVSDGGQGGGASGRLKCTHLKVESDYNKFKA